MDWQPVRGYEGGYEVSSLGDVRKSDGTPLKQWPNDAGYMLVRLSSPRAVKRVHRLVADAFLPNPAAKPFVNHIDHSPSNNAVSNLEWCTQQENLAHARQHGRMADDFWKGRRSPNAALADETVAEIRNLHATGAWSWGRLSQKFGVSKRAVGRIVRGETYVDV